MKALFLKDLFVARKYLRTLAILMVFYVVLSIYLCGFYLFLFEVKLDYSVGAPAAPLLSLMLTRLHTLRSAWILFFYG